MSDTPTMPPGREGSNPVPRAGRSTPWDPPPQDAVWVGEEAEPEINVAEYLHLLWRQRWIILAVVLLCVLVGSAWVFTRTKVYRASSKLALEAATQIVKSEVYTGPSWWELQHYAKNQVQVLETRRLAARVAQKLGLVKPNASGDSDPTAGLLSRIRVKPIEDTNVIQVTMTATDPNKAAEWLNVYVQEYIAINIEDNLERTRKVYQVIQSKLDPLRKQLEGSEQRLLSFKERKDALLVGDQDKNVITEQVNTLTSAYAQAKADRIELETKINALKRLRSENISEASFPEVLNDPTIQGLRQQKNQLEVELAEKLRTYKSGHPVIKDLRSRISSIDGRITNQIKTIVDSLQTNYEIRRRREAALYDNLQQLRQQSIELSKQTLEYDKLQHEYDQNKKFYEQMLQRSKETDISSTAGLNNIRVIDPARPPKTPYSPNPPRTLALSLVLGLFLGVGLVLGLDFIDQTIRTPDDSEKYLGLEALAAVPHYSDDSAHMTREVFQSLRTAIMVASREEGPQVVMITSAAPTEGKTTTAFNLGKALAASGSRVLVIDSDLRKPRFHRFINAKNVRGLTSIVLGERELGDVIHTLADLPNLDIITSGPLPPNPPELFSKSSFRRMLENAKTHYDWILLDTPPVASVTDAVICSQHADMVLLVVRYGEVKRAIIKNALRNLVRAGARIAGAVLNDVDLERDHYYYSYYYSYYHYGYSEAVEHPGKGKKRKGA